jgi:two-component system response regulator PilR (NtrC family)
MEQLKESVGPGLLDATQTTGSYEVTSPIHSKSAFDFPGHFGRNRAPRMAGVDVLLFDPVATRRGLISQTVVEAGGTAHVVIESALEDVSALPACCRIALVALGTPFGETSPALELIARLKTSGFEVVTYEENVRQWPVRVKCLALLTGAAQVLDSGSTRFALELRCVLAKVFRAQARKQMAKEAVQSVMRELGIVGETPAMLEVFEKVTRFSSLSDLPVLITGETGTGKELLARAIHRLDPKHNQGPFVPVNCAAINPGLLESEFFGHRRGAFTGAEHGRKGLIRAAERGVLFLDEIGELDLRLQAKLLRVLQENSVLTMGEERETPVNVRFIAATNRDLQRMVVDQAFRADLFHRLRGLMVRISPVRERRADLSLLIEHLVQKHYQKQAGATPSVSLDFLQAFQQLELRGNVRELENLVCEALANHQGEGDLGLNDLPLDKLRELTEAAQHTPSSDAGTSPVCGLGPSRGAEGNGEFVKLDLDSVGWSFARAMCECERQVLLAAMHHTRGNQTQSARLLGIGVRSAYRKMHKYHLEI